MTVNIHDLTRDLFIQNDSKIVMLVADGLGGLPLIPGGMTELETARTPNLDELAKIGVQGGSIPVFPGISPGSGPGHLGLFGYDPIMYPIGRGALEATGIGFELADGDVAVRCNFCTLDSDGNISDRRAGRIPTEESAPLAQKLDAEIRIDGVEIIVRPVKEHRFVVVFRGPRLDGNVDDTDPQQTGIPPLAPQANDSGSEKTAQLAAEFVTQAQKNPRWPTQSQWINHARLCSQTKNRFLSRCLRSAGCSNRSLSHVQGPSQFGGNGYCWQRNNA